MKRVLTALGKAACYVLLFFGMQTIVTFAFSIAGGVGLAVRFIHDNSMPDMTALIEAMTDFIMEKAVLISIISGLFTLLFLFLFYKIRKTSFIAKIYAQRSLPGLAHVPVFLGGMCFAGFVAIFLSLLPIPESVWEEYSLTSSYLGGNDVITVIGSIIIAPVVEEIIFRGLVYTRLRRAMPVWAAVLLSSFMFGLLHGQLIWICYAFAVGVAMAVIFERTGTVRASILFHLAFNLAGGYLAVFLPASPIICCLLAAAVTFCWILLERLCPYTKLKPEDN